MLLVYLVLIFKGEALVTGEPLLRIDTAPRFSVTPAPRGAESFFS
jgi:hypothetical protein